MNNENEGDGLTKTEEIFRSNRCPYRNIYQGLNIRLLFVCTAGLLRSPTCATIGSQLGFNTRCAGSEDQYALIPVTWNLVQWADNIIFVEQKNYDETLKKFSGNQEIVNVIKLKAKVWNIPDDYEYMENMLVKIIKDRFDEEFGSPHVFRDID